MLNARRERGSTQYRRNAATIRNTEEICYLCGQYVDKSLPRNAPGAAQVDHFIPLASGGTSELENLRLAHRICNLRKGKRTPNQLLSDHIKRVAVPMFTTVTPSAVNFFDDDTAEVDDDPKENECND